MARRGAGQRRYWSAIRAIRSTRDTSLPNARQAYRELRARYDRPVRPADVRAHPVITARAVARAPRQLAARRAAETRAARQEARTETARRGHETRRASAEGQAFIEQGIEAPAVYQEAPIAVTEPVRELDALDELLDYFDGLDDFDDYEDIEVETNAGYKEKK